MLVVLSNIRQMTLASRGKGYLIAILAVALATMLRLGLGLLWPSLPIFGLYYIATLFVTVTCGIIEGVTAAALGTVTGWWLFVPPQYSFFPVPDDTAASIVLSFFISAAIVAIAARE
jgi:K+-sensing histidine kinase KdpD